MMKNTTGKNILVAVPCSKYSIEGDSNGRTI